MNRHRFTALFLLLIPTVVMVTFMSVSFKHLTVPKPLLKDDKSHSLLVDTPACRIPDLDPYDPSVVKLIQPRGTITCDRNPSMFFEDGRMLRVNWTVVNKYYNGSLDGCVYRPLLVHNDSDSKFNYGTAQNISKDIKVADQFIQVICLNTPNSTRYKNFHSFVIPDKQMEEECEQKRQHHLLQNKTKELLNVVMLGVDSLSRLNFIRQMPRTRKYLLEQMEAIELFGYTKVADDTFNNIVPLLSGKFVEELPWSMEKLEKFDKYKFVWKDFANNGYRTSYVEDSPTGDTFHYKKKGFVKSPTHYYNRVMAVAMEKHKDLWNPDKSCVGDRLEGDIVLKQTRNFLTVHKFEPNFSFTFITRMTHDYTNYAGAADDPHFRNLRLLNEGGLLKNTILVFFSDHGCRFGEIRETFVGKIEERFPACYLVLPSWFRKKYPDLVNNMKINARRLTTHFDLYETIKQIANFDGLVRIANVSQRGISLFSEIPSNRSCEKAGILPHWCVCLETKRLQSSTPLVKQGARQVVDHINTLLQNHRNVCHTLVLAGIRNPVEMGANKEVIEHLHRKKEKSAVIVQLTVETEPGEALFESTFSFDPKIRNYTLMGAISRINKYGQQSYCIDDFELKKYCYCK